MYEIKTPAMKRVVEVANYVIDNVLSGSLEPKAGQVVNSANNTLIRAQSNDLRTRLAIPKLNAQEAKLVEHEKAPAQSLAAG